MVYLVAHRGMGKNFEENPERPRENTLCAFLRAIALGANVIEFDCRRTKDGRVVVIHDETLDRTTNGTGLVSEKTFEDISALRIGQIDTIPALEHALDRIDGKAVCNLHLSGQGIAEPVAKILKEYIGNGWNLEEFLVSSFDFETLQTFRKLMPDVRLGLLINGVPQESKWVEQCAEIRAHSLHINIAHVNSATVKRVHSNGLKVFVWTARSIPEIQEMKDLLGPDDYINSDYPELFGLFK